MRFCRLNGRLAASVCVVAGLTLAGCVTATSRDAGQGKYAAVVEGTAQTDYSQLSAFDHYNVCKALQSLQRYSELDRCLPQLRARVGKDPFSPAPLFSYNADFVEILVEGIEVQKHLALGRYDTAYQNARAAYDASHRKPQIIMNSAYSAMTSILTLGINNINDEDGVYAQQIRTHAKIEPLGMLATVEALRGNAEAAQGYREDLLEILAGVDKSEFNNGPQLASIRRWLGQSYFIEGKYEDAYAAFVRDDRSDLDKVADGFFDALTFLEKPILEPIAYAATGTNLDDVTFVHDFPLEVMIYRAAYKSGRLDQARAGYDKVLQEPRVANFGDTYFQLLYERGQIAVADGDRTEAGEYFRRAIDVLERQRSHLESEAYKLGFVGNRNDVYQDLVVLLVEEGDAVAAFDYAERAKARAMVDMLASRSQFAADNPQAAALVGELDALERKSVEIVSLDADSQTTRAATLDQKRQALQAAAPELASLVTVSPEQAAAIQARLAPDEVLLEYFGQGENLYAFTVTRNEIRAVALPRFPLASTVTNFRRSVQNVRADAYMVAGQRVYDRLIAPVADQLSGKRLTIVPHGPLHYVPFAALHDGSGFLIDRYNLRILPSASVMRFLNKDTTPTEELLAFGNPDLGDPSLDLPGAENETRAIDKGWAQSRILLRQYASESSFKKFAPAFRYLHLASHGQFDPEAPLSSRLLLAPGEGEDGSLTVDELYGLRLNADLVTLSACDTGLGTVETGDDVIGLTRGFLYAGAQSVVASLWPVSDEGTAYLMERFYRNLRTMPKAQALRAAMIETRKEFPHPVYWSAFQLTGSV